MAEMATKTDAESENNTFRQRSNSDPKPAVEPIHTTSENIGMYAKSINGDLTNCLIYLTHPVLEK